jgi:hypothetical protein
VDEGWLAHGSMVAVCLAVQVVTVWQGLRVALSNSESECDFMSAGPYDSVLQRSWSAPTRGWKRTNRAPINEAADICGMNYNTVHSYVYSELLEVNLRMPPPKKIIPKQNCGCFDGLVVDPPESPQSNCDPSVGISVDLTRGIGVVSGSLLALDGTRRLVRGNQWGALNSP